MAQSTSYTRFMEDCNFHISNISHPHYQYDQKLVDTQFGRHRDEEKLCFMAR